MGLGRVDIRITHEGEIAILHGIDQPPSAVHERNRHFIVLKVPGHKFWGGIGQLQNYAPAQFQVFQILAEHGERISTKHIISFDIRKGQ